MLNDEIEIEKKQNKKRAKLKMNEMCEAKIIP